MQNNTFPLKISFWKIEVEGAVTVLKMRGSLLSVMLMVCGSQKMGRSDHSIRERRFSTDGSGFRVTE